MIKRWVVPPIIIPAALAICLAILIALSRAFERRDNDASLRKRNIERIAGGIGFRPAEAGTIDVLRVAIEAMHETMLPDRMIGVRVIVGRARANAFELGYPDSDFSKPLIVSEFDIGFGHWIPLSSFARTGIRGRFRQGRSVNHRAS